MKVLHVYRTYFPDTQGGLEEVVRQICLNTRSHDIENRVFTLSKIAIPELIKRGEADVYRYKQNFEIASCGFSIQALLNFKRHAEWADIIHYQAPWPFADMLHVLLRIKKPALVTYQSDIVRQKTLAMFYKPLMNIYFKSLQRIIATSDNYVNSSTVLKKYVEKTQVIPIGIDKESYQEETQPIVQQLKQQYGEGFFLFVGVLRYYKGLSYLLEALKDTDFPVLIAGFGPEEQNLKKQAEELNLNHVKFLGYVSDQEKTALYKLSKAIVFPSCERSEAYGVTLLEASMYGKPMISTELQTGTSFINLDGETGLVVEPKNSGQLKAALDKLQENPEMVSAMGEAANQRYQQMFTGKKMGAAYAKLYRQILTELNVLS